MTGDELKAYIHTEVRQRMDLTREMEDEEIMELICRIITEVGKEQYLSIRLKEELAATVFASVRKLDILQEQKL